MGPIKALDAQLLNLDTHLQCHPAVERRTAERNRTFLQHPTFFRREQSMLVVISHLPVPHQDPPATCPPRASLEGLSWEQTDL